METKNKIPPKLRRDMQDEQRNITHEEHCPAERR
jgi:hypothetical protein